jgi:hypothetical protein
MYELFQGLRWAHVTAGTVALALFWIPIAAKKGDRLHVRIGWVYTGCMAIVVATALSMSGLAFAAPVSVRNFAHTLSPSEAARFIRASRQTAFFLAYLGGVTLAAGWQGLFALRTRRDPGAMRTPFALGLNVAVLLAAIASLAVGIYTRNAIYAAMSSVGFLVSSGNLFYLLRRPERRMEWWYQHLRSMFITGIAGYTAFLVFGGRQLFLPLIGPQYMIAFWVLPTMIGVPAIMLAIGYYQRRFRDQGSAENLSNT